MILQDNSKGKPLNECMFQAQKLTSGNYRVEWIEPLKQDVVNDSEWWITYDQLLSLEGFVWRKREGSRILERKCKKAGTLIKKIDEQRRNNKNQSN